MKKLLALIASILIAVPAFAQVTAEDLMNLGVPAPLAKYFTDNAIALSVLTNNAALSSANATPSATNIALLKLSASDQTLLSAGSGKSIGVGPSFTPVWEVDAAKMLSDLGVGVIAAPTRIALAVGAANTPNINADSAGITYVTAGMGENLPAGTVFTPATNLTPTAGARLLSNRLGAVATAAPTAAYVFAQPTASVGKVVRVYNQGANPLQILPEDGTINAAAALTPFACTAGKMCTCYGLSSSQMVCGLQ